MTHSLQPTTVVTTHSLHHHLTDRRPRQTIRNMLNFTNDELRSMERFIVDFKLKRTTPPRSDLSPYIADMRIGIYDKLANLFSQSVDTYQFRMIWYDAGRTLETAIPLAAGDAALGIGSFIICAGDGTTLVIEPTPHVPRLHTTAIKDEVNHGQIKITSDCPLSDDQIESSVKRAFLQQTGIRVIKCKPRNDKDFGFAIGYYHTPLDPATFPAGDEFMTRVATISLASGIDAQFFPSPALANKLGICNYCCKPNNRYKKWCDCLLDDTGKIVKSAKRAAGPETKKRNHEAAIDRMRKKQKAAANAAGTSAGE